MEHLVEENEKLKEELRDLREKRGQERSYERRTEAERYLGRERSSEVEKYKRWPEDVPRPPHVRTLQKGEESDRGGSRGTRLRAQEYLTAQSRWRPGSQSFRVRGMSRGTWRNGFNSRCRHGR